MIYKRIQYRKNQRSNRHNESWSFSKIRRLLTSITVAIAVGLVLISSHPQAVSAQSFGALTVDWAAVIDNGEGTDWPDGPIGNFHVLVYEAGRRCPGVQNSYDHSKALRHFVLKGPTKEEWDDGDQRSYGYMEVFRWRSANDAVVVFIYESDPVKVPLVPDYRKDDPLFCRQVSRTQTQTARVFASERTANDDAINRARQRGGAMLERDLVNKGAWTGGIRQGMPKMFLRLHTVPVLTPVKLIAKHSNKCLDVVQRSHGNGTVIQQTQCHGKDNQQFYLKPVVGRQFQIIAKHSSKCVDVDISGAPNADGTKIQQWDCLGPHQLNQLWTLEPLGGYYRIVAGHSSKCLDVAEVSKKNRTPVHQWTCIRDREQANQLWRLEAP